MNRPIKRWLELEPSPERRAFIDPVESLQTAAWIVESGDFDLQGFFELCNLLEAVVLREQLLSTPPRLPKELRISTRSSFADGLMAEGILQLVEWPHHTIQNLESGNPKHKRKTAWNSWLKTFHRVEDELSKMNDGVHITSMFAIGAARILGENLHPSLHNRSAYAKALRVHESERALTDLTRIYGEMSRSFQADMTRLAHIRRQRLVPIPPIPLLILSKVSRRAEILEEALSLRARLSSVRSAFREYDTVIRDETLPLKKSLNALSTLRSVSAEVTRKFDQNEKQLIVEWKDLADLVPEGMEFDTKEVSSFTKLLLGKPLEWIVARLRRRRFLPLYWVRKESFRVRDYGSNIHRLWGVDPFHGGRGVLRTFEISMNAGSHIGPKSGGIPFSRGAEIEFDLYGYS